MFRISLIIGLIGVLTLSMLFAETVIINPIVPKSVSMDVLESQEDYTVIQISLNNYEKDTIEINGEEYLSFKVSRQGMRLEAGIPELPIVGKSLVIPAQAKMQVEVLNSSFTEIYGNAMPSKGNLLRSVNPEDIPFEFSSVYFTDAFFPAEIAELSDPYIMRELRGITFRLNHFTVNPVQNIIRVYDSITIRVYADGIDTENTMPSRSSRITTDFVQVYEQHFLNYESVVSRYIPITEQGSMLVICYPEFMETAQPYVDWKIQKGIPTVMIPSTTAGTTGAQIKTYIENYFAQHPDLTYVQIMGDGPQVPSINYQSWASDPTYGMILGNDHYPEIFVGRFSAETIPQLETQILRTIWYERDLTDAPWIDNAMGLAGAETGGHYGQSDKVHMEAIRQRFLAANTYLHVDDIYQPQATPTMVSAALNEGRSLINYIAHGSTQGWHFLSAGGATMDYTSTHVNALVNDWMLPHVVSVACDVGIFASGAPVFAEHWMRATNNTTGDPTGAIAFYGASMSQPWQPPMYAQDEIADLHIDETFKTTGGLYFNGSMAMLDIYPGTNTNNTMRTWHIFGDASLVVRSANPVAMEIIPPDILFIGLNEFTIFVDTPGALISLYDPETGEIVVSAIANDNGFNVITLDEPFTDIQTLLLTITAYNKITYIEELQVVPNNMPFLTFNSFSFPENESPDYGETVTLNITVNNVGGMDAEDVTATLLTGSQYVTLLENTTTIEVIDANSIYEFIDVFSFTIAHDVPDQRPASFTLRTQSGDDVWLHNFQIILNAPEINTAGYEVDDPLGNINNRFDPGETVELKIPFTNSGHALSSAGNIVMFSNNPLITFLENTAIVPAIEPDGISYAVFTVTADESIPMGSSVAFGFYSEFSTKTIQTSLDIPIGLLIEDFETGDFDMFDWVHVGQAQWTITDETVYEGQYSLATGNISNYQSSAIEVQVSLSAPGTISFYYKVSTLANVDKMQFRVNNVIQGDWSGEIDWTYYEWNLPAGNHTLRWVYLKGPSGSAGADKGWIDYITFPALGGEIINSPIFYTATEVIEFDDIDITETYSQDFMIINLGNAPLQGEISVPERFTLLPGSGVQTIDYTIGAYNNATYTLVYNPEDMFEFIGEMTISTNDETRPLYTIELIVYGDPVSTNDPIALETRLIGNYPNPFNPETSISFHLANSQNVEIGVYNIRGQLVKTIINDTLEKGNHTITWNGTDSNNTAVSSGVYFYKFISADLTQVNKMILLK